jgi:hypothetical protein
MTMDGMAFGEMIDGQTRSIVDGWSMHVPYPECLTNLGRRPLFPNREKRASP